MNRWGQNNTENIGIPFSGSGAAQLYLYDLYSINSQSEHIEESMEILRAFLEDLDSGISPLKKIAEKNVSGNIGRICIYNPLRPGFFSYTEDKPENQTDRSSIYIKITKELIGEYISLIDGAKPSGIIPRDIVRIINSELNDLYNGKGADIVAKNIQNRVSLYYSERE